LLLLLLLLLSPVNGVSCESSLICLPTLPLSVPNSVVVLNQCLIKMNQLTSQQVPSS